jgi:hypothetical protein
MVTVPVVVSTLTSKVASLPFHSISTLGVTPAGMEIVALPVASSVTVVMTMFLTTLNPAPGSYTARPYATQLTPGAMLS